MRAIVHDPGAPQGLRLTEVPVPRPGPGQVLVAVEAASLNFADIGFLADRGAPGAVPGFDAAGVVVAGAADGSGPPPGTRVVTFDWSGGWAEQRAVDTGELAVVPDHLDLGAAAAIPVAGVTARRALRLLGPLAGRRVLVTGAAGGVGGFAVQLAALEGAEVIASVGRPERAAGLDALGAAEVVVGLDGVTPPIHGALDNVGGPTLAAAYALLAPGGTVASVGMASGQPTTIDFEQARLRGGDTRIVAFAIGPGFGPDLAALVELVAAGRLDPLVGWRGPWDKVGEAASALLGRTVRGKAVLEVTP
jgi:NADPH:quinone reductase-like Zn-dependent oxidoreductase